MSDRNDRMKPGEWEKLKAEWMHNSGLRRMENRGVKYEDEAQRVLDPAADRGTGGGQVGPLAQGQATVTTPGRAALPPHPWPSEIAEANRHQPGKDNGNGHENGHDAGHSM